MRRALLAFALLFLAACTVAESPPTIQDATTVDEFKASGAGHCRRIRRRIGRL